MTSERMIIEMLRVQIEILDGNVPELEVWMLLLREPDHFAGDINAQAPARAQRRKQVACPAPYFEDAGVGRHIKLRER